MSIAESMRMLRRAIASPPLLFFDVATTGAAGYPLSHAGSPCEDECCPPWIVPIQSGAGASDGCHQRRASFGRHGRFQSPVQSSRHQDGFMRSLVEVRQ
jgi:hypothetical protein